MTPGFRIIRHLACQQKPEQVRVLFTLGGHLNNYILFKDLCQDQRPQWALKLNPTSTSQRVKTRATPPSHHQHCQTQRNTPHNLIGYIECN